MYRLVIEGSSPADLWASVAAISALSAAGVAAPALAIAAPVPAIVQPAAPVAPVVTLPPVAAVAGVELDSRGMPWDKRIHASTRAKNQDGSWRNKRNTDANLITAVEAELMGGAAPTPTPMPTPAPVPVPQPVAIVPRPDPVAAAPVPVNPAVPAVAAGNTFASVQTAMSSALRDGSMTAADVVTMSAQLGVNGPAEIIGNQELIDRAAQFLADL